MGPVHLVDRDRWKTTAAGRTALAIAPLAMLVFNLAYGIVLPCLRIRYRRCYRCVRNALALRETARAKRWRIRLGHSRIGAIDVHPPRQFLAAQRGRIDTLNGRIRNNFTLFRAARADGIGHSAAVRHRLSVALFNPADAAVDCFFVVRAFDRGKPRALVAVVLCKRVFRLYPMASAWH